MEYYSSNIVIAKYPGLQRELWFVVLFLGSISMGAFIGHIHKRFLGFGEGLVYCKFK